MHYTAVIMNRVFAIVIIVAGFWVAGAGHACAQSPPPPTPTLAPVVGPDPSATQTLQLQAFTRDLYYYVQHTTSYTTTTSSGAPWALERRVSYGDASVVIVLLVVALLQIGGLVIQFSTRGRRR